MYKILKLADISVYNLPNSDDLLYLKESFYEFE
jgi:hypothetical protein